MGRLLYMPCSARSTESWSREIGDAVVAAYRAELPGAEVVVRDLGRHPVPHIDEDGVVARFVPSEQRTPGQAAAMALQDELIDEVLAADAFLFGVPLYNLGVPSSFKAWLDQIVVVGRTLSVDVPPLAGRPAVVVSSRGGGYGPGTPRDGWDFVVPYVHRLLGESLGLDVTVVISELTHAYFIPLLASLRPLAEASHAAAMAQAADLARLLARARTG